MKYLTLFTFLVHTLAASACYMPKNGSGWNADELIDRSEVIVIAELLERENSGRTTICFLKPIETLKGDAPETIEFHTVDKAPAKNPGSDFEGHRSEEFWEEDGGRSDWPCCICGPNHTFEKSVKYLLFPDAFGAIKSAEIVRSEEDEWLKYVRRKTI